MSAKEIITGIVDKNLEDIINNNINSHPGKIAPEMADSQQDPNEEWRKWFPIPSTVTDQEIAIIEEELGYKLPDDYKVFLKHKHFISLYVGEADFCRHAIHTWQDSLRKLIFKGYPKEYLLDEGLIPFAAWNDWGLLCFDTRGSKDHNYPVVIWDHELPEDTEEFAEGFVEMMVKLDEMEIENYD